MSQVLNIRMNTKFFENPALKTRIKSSSVKIQEMAFGYLLAPFCAMISNAIFGSYLNRYYVDVLGWTKFGAFATLLPMLSSILVILGNIMVGQWIDNTRTPAGKARPYLLISIPLIATRLHIPATIRLTARWFPFPQETQTREAFSQPCPMHRLSLRPVSERASLSRFFCSRLCS